MRKVMGRVLVGLGLWIVLSELFLIVLWRLSKRTSHEEEQAGDVPPSQDAPQPPQGDTLPTWKRCSACTTYVRAVAQHCPCGGRYRPVTQSQMVRAFVVQSAASEAIPADEQEAFAAFALRYEEMLNGYVPVKVSLQLYHLSQAQDEVAR